MDLHGAVINLILFWKLALLVGFWFVICKPIEDICPLLRLDN